jgi:hypothetical protein
MKKFYGTHVLNGFFSSWTKKGAFRCYEFVVKKKCFRLEPPVTSLPRQQMLISWLPLSRYKTKKKKTNSNN